MDSVDRRPCGLEGAGSAVQGENGSDLTLRRDGDWLGTRRTCRSQLACPSLSVRPPSALFLMLVQQDAASSLPTTHLPLRPLPRGRCVNTRSPGSPHARR